jgi:hypothetical protein
MYGMRRAALCWRKRERNWVPYVDHDCNSPRFPMCDPQCLSQTGRTDIMVSLLGEFTQNEGSRLPAESSAQSLGKF